MNDSFNSDCVEPRTRNTQKNVGDSQFALDKSKDLRDSSSGSSSEDSYFNEDDDEVDGIQIDDSSQEETKQPRRPHGTNSETSFSDLQPTN